MMAVNRMFWLQPHRSCFSESVNNGVCLLIAVVESVFVSPCYSGQYMDAFFIRFIDVFPCPCFQKLLQFF
ncbi:hypothetical protein B9Y60_10625 [Stenotrophomonas maltophilia]|nr:hypothetical protein B9Y73_10625 [Stenotrophomonas maltophilia]PJL55130.1 hypothetical protein B9Y60_10625 [Stenotrophomonas maltophilia]